MWVWKAMVMMIPAGETLTRPPELSGNPTSRDIWERVVRNGRRSENFAYQYLRYIKGFLTCCKILWHGFSGFTFHPKEVVLRIFIALKIPSPRPCLNPQHLDAVANKLTTTLPSRPVRSWYVQSLSKSLWSNILYQSSVQSSSVCAISCYSEHDGIIIHELA
jgi:hypothetical protein